MHLGCSSLTVSYCPQRSVSLRSLNAWSRARGLILRMLCPCRAAMSIAPYLMKDHNVKAHKVC